jgi:hypothetical protein
MTRSTTRLACTVVVALGVFLAAGATARAQDFEAAGKHFSAAQEAFGAKHFKTAAAEFEAAYGITKDPVLLYNVGESYEKAGEGRKAVANYKAYLKEQPTAQDKAEVQKRIKSIEGKGYKLASQSAPGDNPPTSATTAPTPTPTPTPPATPPPTTPSTPPPTLKEPPPTMPSTAPTTTETAPPTTPAPKPIDTVLPPPPEPTPPPPVATTTPPPAEQPPPGLIDEGPSSKLRVGAWIGVAVTLAVLTAGAIFGLSAESRADEINRRLSFVDTNNQPHKFDQSMQSDLSQLKDDGNLYNGLAIGFYTVAAVSAVVTVTLFVVDAKRGKAEKKQAAWHLAPVVGKNAGGFALGGSF